MTGPVTDTSTKVKGFKLLRDFRNEAIVGMTIHENNLIVATTEGIYIKRQGYTTFNKIDLKVEEDES